MVEIHVVVVVVVCFWSVVVTVLFVTEWAKRLKAETSAKLWREYAEASSLDAIDTLEALGKHNGKPTHAADYRAQVKALFRG